jgi:uncharacterized protein (TIGR03435 family)
MRIRAILVLSIAACSQAQTFEAADVKPNKSGESRMMVDFQAGGRFVAHNVPMEVLIGLAYHLRPEYVQGGPGWLSSERYDVVAKGSQTASPDELQLMVRNLLVERFKLAAHTNVAPMPAYALVTAKNGSKLQPSDAGALSEQRCVPGEGDPAEKHVVCRRLSMAVFAATLQELAPRDLNVPVVDQTGLKGTFDFKLDWTPTLRTPVSDAAPGTTIFDAVERQLGLKLENRKLPLPVLVVDSVERVPIEN